MMLTPCWPSAGPTGGAGLAMPALICSLMTAASFFFFGGISLPDFCWVCGAGVSRARAWPGGRAKVRNRSDLGDLRERQLDRSLAAEDRDQDLELLAVGVDLVDRGRQRG